MCSGSPTRPVWQGSKHHDHFPDARFAADSSGQLASTPAGPGSVPRWSVAFAGADGSARAFLLVLFKHAAQIPVSESSFCLPGERLGLCSGQTFLGLGLSSRATGCAVGSGGGALPSCWEDRDLWRGLRGQYAVRSMHRPKSTKSPLLAVSDSAAIVTSAT